MLGIVRVSGSSMSPRFNSGDLLLVLRRVPARWLKPGACVTVQHARFGPLIKQISVADSQGLRLCSLASIGLTEEQIGYITPEEVRSLVICRLSAA